MDGETQSLPRVDEHRKSIASDIITRTWYVQRNPKQWNTQRNRKDGSRGRTGSWGLTCHLYRTDFTITWLLDSSTYAVRSGKYQAMQTLRWLFTAFEKKRKRKKEGFLIQSFPFENCPSHFFKTFNFQNVQNWKNEIKRKNNKEHGLVKCTEALEADL